MLVHSSNPSILEALRYFNIGGSFDAGYQSNNNTPQPTYFETANDQTSGSGAISVSPTFLHLNNNAIELGQRVQWAADTVWFYKSLMLMAEYGGARAGYGFVNSKASTPVNFSGYHVTASYFLTGEQLTRRVNVVKPRRDFNFGVFTGGPFSPGAWEAYARFSTFDVGRNIFTAGFADPNLWTNHAWTTDIGLNWYLNFYTRIYLDWQHAMFGNQVSVAPGRSRRQPTCSGCGSRSSSRKTSVALKVCFLCSLPLYVAFKLVVDINCLGRDDGVGGERRAHEIGTLAHG